MALRRSAELARTDATCVIRSGRRHLRDCSIRRLLSKSAATSGDEYDYVVVGAGSAGCTVSNRLVLGDTKARVLVTEAGPAGDQSWRVRTPGTFLSCVGNPDIDWNYQTVPQKHANNRVFTWPRGKVLGGSSCLNAMVYIRGHPADFDRWAFKEGATGWSYAECLPYFIRSQKHELGSNQYRGASGYLGVSCGTSRDPLFDAFVEAGRQAGYPVTEDFNAVQQEGFGRYDFTIYKGKRSSTAAAYLRPAMKEAGSRLTVSTDTLVHRVLFNGRRAVGIEYQIGGKGTPLKRAYASREVILCGGALNSPQLLLLSGVGPADELRRHNIQVVHHSPGVGSNLQDHVRVAIEYNCKKSTNVFRNQSGRPLLKVRTYLTWLLASSGDLITPAGCQSGGFVRSRPDVEHPDLQFHFMPPAFDDNPRHGNSIETFINTSRETSRGTLTLKSADPYEHPVLDPNYLATEDDIADLRAAVHVGRQVFSQRALDDYRGDELSPGKNVQSDREIDAFVRETAETIYHQCGTCRMGSPDKDDMVVVDPACRVVGVEGLRVVDASVMPSVTSGNINAPTIMIAEKAADLILGKKALPKANVPDWKQLK